jgi:hypothetical protein
MEALDQQSLLESGRDLVLKTLNERAIAIPLTCNQVRGFRTAWGGLALDGLDSLIYALVLVPAMRDLLPASGIEPPAGNFGFLRQYSLCYLLGWLGQRFPVASNCRPLRPGARPHVPVFCRSGRTQFLSSSWGCRSNTVHKAGGAFSPWPRVRVASWRRERHSLWVRESHITEASASQFL